MLSALKNRKSSLEQRPSLQEWSGGRELFQALSHIDMTQVHFILGTEPAPKHWWGDGRHTLRPVRKSPSAPVLFPGSMLL